MSDKQLIKFDLEKVRTLAAQGLTREMVAASLGVSRSTVQRRLRNDADFLQAIAAGQADMVIELSNLVLTAARRGDVESAKWLLERRGGPAWKKSSQVDVDLSADKPLLNIILTGPAQSNITD